MLMSVGDVGLRVDVCGGGGLRADVCGRIKD